MRKLKGNTWFLVRRLEPAHGKRLRIVSYTEVIQKRRYGKLQEDGSAEFSNGTGPTMVGDKSPL